MCLKEIQIAPQWVCYTTGACTLCYEGSRRLFNMMLCVISDAGQWFINKCTVVHVFKTFHLEVAESKVKFNIADSK